MTPITAKTKEWYYVLEHRLVMERMLGRYLKSLEVVHHINGDPSDNRDENLSIFANQSGHRVLHLKEERCHP